jgi:hypothetical protein
MQGHRQSVVMATKYTNAAPGTDPNAAGNQRKNMVQAVEASLKRAANQLYRSLLGPHLGPDHASERGDARTG